MSLYAWGLVGLPEQWEWLSYLSIWAAQRSQIEHRYWSETPLSYSGAVI